MPVSLTKELAYWDEQTAAVRRGQTQAVRTSATKWAALLTALLGAFSAVAFAGGLNTIDKLDDPWATGVKALTSIAAAAAVLSIVLLNVVAGGLRVRLQRSALTSLQLAEEETVPDPSKLRLLALGQATAVVSAACVLGGSFLVLWAPSAASPAQPVLARFENGAACGTPELDATGKLTVGGRNLARAVEVVTVSKCPKPPADAD